LARAAGKTGEAHCAVLIFIDYEYNLSQKSLAAVEGLAVTVIYSA
jgi:hypothetical protein